MVKHPCKTWKPARLRGDSNKDDVDSDWYWPRCLAESDELTDDELYRLAELYPVPLGEWLSEDHG